MNHMNTVPKNASKTGFHVSTTTGQLVPVRAKTT